MSLLAVTVDASAVVLIDESVRHGEFPAGWVAHDVKARTGSGGYVHFKTPEAFLSTPVLDLQGYTNVLLTFAIAKFGRGDDGPLTVEVSVDGGRTWDAQTFESAVPHAPSPYVVSGPTEITALSPNVVIRWTAANSLSQKRLRNITLTGEHVPVTGSGLRHIRFQGFEGTVGDHWSYVAVPGSGRIAISAEERGQTGRYALQLTGSEDGRANPHVMFDSVDLAGYRDAELSIGFASRGVDDGDDLYVDLSYDNGATWTESHRLVSGFHNFRLDFGQADAARTVDENPFRIRMEPGRNQVRVRGRYEEASGTDNRDDHYYIDQVFLSASGQQPSVWFGETELVVEEGGVARIPVTISGPANAIVQVRMDGTATPGADFTVSATSLVFSARGPTNIWLAVSALDDGIPEGPEYVRFTLEQASGARIAGPDTATLFIRDNDSFAVMAANLPSGVVLNRGLIPYSAAGKRVLRTLRPDIVAIQEVILLPGRELKDFVRGQFGPDFYTYIEPDIDLPNGVISRWPIIAAGSWKDDEVFNRDFVWATIDLPGARNLHIVSVHFKAGTRGGDREVRIRQAEALTNYIARAGFPQDDYLIIAGDLNLTSREERTLEILGAYVSDARQPADQEGNRMTNIPRNRPYDLVLPDPRLDARHIPYAFGGFVFSNGLVFDSRLWGDHPLPARIADSGDFNMQHLPVMKIFELK